MLTLRSALSVALLLALWTWGAIVVLMIFVSLAAMTPELRTQGTSIAGLVVVDVVLIASFFGLAFLVSKARRTLT
jgi:hypothetical protein